LAWDQLLLTCSSHHRSLAQEQFEEKLKASILAFNGPGLKELEEDITEWSHNIRKAARKARGDATLPNNMQRQ
jgi:hypothetical protein